MEEGELKERIRELHENLANAGVEDPELLELVLQLDGDLTDLLERSRAPGGVAADQPLPDVITALETRFASEHPVIERFLRETMEALGKMGI